MNFLEIMATALELMPRQIGPSVELQEEQWMAMNRGFARFLIILVILFILLPLSVLFLSTLHTSLDRSRLWFLFSILICLGILYLSIRYKPGNFWIILGLWLALIFSNGFVFFSLFHLVDIREFVSLARVAYVVATPTGLIAVMIGVNIDRVPMDSMIAPIVYLSRYKQLFSLNQIAKQKGWDFRGPFGKEKIFVISGNYRGYDIRIFTWLEFKLRPKPKNHHLQVEIWSENFIPLLMYGGSHRSQNLAEIAAVKFYHGRPVFFWELRDEEDLENFWTIFSIMLDKGERWLTSSSTLISVGRSLSYTLGSFWKIKINGEEITELIDFLIAIEQRCSTKILPNTCDDSKELT